MVETENGNVVVKVSGASAIQATTTLKNPGRIDYRTEQQGDQVRIIASVKEGPGFFQKSGGADITVLAPERIDLALKTTNGRIEVSGVTGQVSVENSNGVIQLSDVKGIIDVKGSNSRVELDGVAGDLKVVSSNGPVDIQEFVGQVRAETSNGSIDLAGALLFQSENRLKTSNGGVRAILVETPGVELDASTSNGRITVGEGLQFKPRDGARERSLVGTIGSGGSSLEVRTSNGSISVR